MTILFICSGNICRSPMAAACLRARSERAGPRGLVVDSAGLLGIEGEPAAPPAVQALRGIGLDLTGHRSRGLRPADVERADLIVAMTEEHLIELRERFPRGCAKRVLLRAFESGPLPTSPAPDLDDPIGMPLEFYADRLVEIVRSVENLAIALGGA